MHTCRWLLTVPQCANARSLHTHVMHSAQAHHALHYLEYLEQQRACNVPSVCNLWQSKSCTDLEKLQHLAARLSRSVSLQWPAILRTLPTNTPSHTIRHSPSITNSGATWRIAKAVEDVSAQCVRLERRERRLTRKGRQRRLTRGEPPPPPQRQLLHVPRVAPAAGQARATAGGATRSAFLRTAWI